MCVKVGRLSVCECERVCVFWLCTCICVCVCVCVCVLAVYMHMCVCMCVYVCASSPEQAVWSGGRVCVAHWCEIQCLTVMMPPLGSVSKSQHLLLHTTAQS